MKELNRTRLKKIMRDTKTQIFRVRHIGEHGEWFWAVRYALENSIYDTQCEGIDEAKAMVEADAYFAEALNNRIYVVDMSSVILHQRWEVKREELIQMVKSLPHPTLSNAERLGN